MQFRRTEPFDFSPGASSPAFLLPNILRLIYFTYSAPNVHEKILNFSHNSDIFQKMVKSCFRSLFLLGLPAQFPLCFLALFCGFAVFCSCPLQTKTHIPSGLAFRAGCAFLKGFCCCRGICVPSLGGCGESSFRLCYLYRYYIARMYPEKPAHSCGMAALTPSPCEPWPPARSPPAGWGGSGS